RAVEGPASREMLLAEEIVEPAAHHGVHAGNDVDDNDGIVLEQPEDVGEEIKMLRGPKRIVGADEVEPFVATLHLLEAVGALDRCGRKVPAEARLAGRIELPDLEARDEWGVEARTALPDLAEDLEHGRAREVESLSCHLRDRSLDRQQAQTGRSLAPV